MYFDYFRNYLILGVFCKHFDIAKVTYLPPNLRIFLTFRPKHSQDLLWFSHSTDVFKHMFLLQTYVQVSENNFFWIHLIDFSLKSIEQTRKKNPMKLFFRKWVLTIFFLLFPCSVFLSFFSFFFLSPVFSSRLCCPKWLRPPKIVLSICGDSSLQYIYTLYT